MHYICCSCSLGGHDLVSPERSVASQRSLIEVLLK